MIPAGFIAAIDWLYGTQRSWSRLRRGTRRRQGYLAVAIRIAELGGVRP